MLALTTIALILPPLAHGDLQNPPSVTLRIDGREQRGGGDTTSWSYGESDGLCTGGISDPAPGQEPNAVRRGSHRARIQFHYPIRPEKVSIVAYEKVASGGYPRGRGTRLDFELMSKAKRGEEIWLAEFDLEVTGDRYLDVYARWPTQPPCGPGGERRLGFYLTSPKRQSGR